MKIGIVIGRIGGVDGVGLETEKWISVLKGIGHEVYILSGQFEGKKKRDPDKESLFPILSFFSPECLWEQEKAFFKPDKNPAPLQEKILINSKLIAEKIKAWIREKNLDFLISQNASALPAHLSMALGIKTAVLDTGIKTITHDHDYHWERGKRYLSPHPEINKLINNTFPLQASNVVNVVINSAAKNTLKKKFELDARLIPNVMNFNRPFGMITKKNKNFLKDMGFEKKDVPLFQITRIVKRKGIETAIRLIHLLDNNRIKLVITGNHNDDEGAAYYSSLLSLINELKLTKQVFFAEKKVLNHQQLSDAYAHARACTYFSTYEGFGNAFVECVLAKKPIFVNNYKPVFWPDIGSKGFETVMLENNELTDGKVKRMEEIIFNEKIQKEIVEHNYQLGKKYFSFEVLEGFLNQLFNTALSKVIT